MNKKIISFILLSLFLLGGCSTVKFVPEGKYLLDNVSIDTDSKEVSGGSLKSYLKQQPNTKTLNLIKLPLKIYSLSGKDSTKWINKRLRKAGSPPVIYDSELTEASVEELERVLYNKGYLNAEANVDSTIKGKRINLNYRIKTGEVYTIRNFSYNCEDSLLQSLYTRRRKRLGQLSGENFDLDKLNEERERITTLSRNFGRYYFNKDFISYTADSTLSPHQIDLVMNVQPPASMQEAEKKKAFKVAYIDRVYLHILPNREADDTTRISSDTLYRRGFFILSNGNPWINPETLIKASSIQPGMHYSDRLAENTYASFSRIPIIKFSSIVYRPREEIDSSLLDCHIYVSEAKTFSVNAEVMGTNTGGDLGVALSVGFQHKNLFKKGIILDAKVHGAYEHASITSGNYNYNYYYEYGGELSLTFSRLLLPFLSEKKVKRWKGTSSLSLSYNYQIRPEYERIHTDVAWTYKVSPNPFTQHRIDLPNIGFVKLPYISPDFSAYLLEKSPLMSYGFESHFIFGAGYSFSHSNHRSNRAQKYTYSLKASVETSGNFLYAISSLTHQKKNSEGWYELFDFPYSQYVRFDFKVSNAIALGRFNSLHFCLALGAAIPYGNSNSVPSEKQFFAGGSNNVRGWSMRSLGPGNYTTDRSKSFGGYYYQPGDLSLYLSAEYRAKLFWKLESALFFDAGNVWLLKKNLLWEGGTFSTDRFLGEIALAYGIGLRLNLSFLVFRLDWGLKLYDPAGSGSWVNPFQKNGNNLNLAIGYPF